MFGIFRDSDCGSLDGRAVTKMSEKDTREEAMRAFRQFDVERTGKISFENLKVVSREVSRTNCH